MTIKSHCKLYIIFGLYFITGLNVILANNDESVLPNITKEKVLTVDGFAICDDINHFDSVVGIAEKNELLLCRNIQIDHPINFQNVTIVGCETTRSSGQKMQKYSLETVGEGSVHFGPNSGLRDCFIKNLSQKP